MHSEALNDKGREIFPHLASFQDFYLAGGTALALQIGHRQSLDFDLFNESAISQELLPKIKRVFSSFSAIIPLVNNPDELTVLIDHIKVTLLRYPFPVIQGFVTGEQVRFLTVPEIAATKAYTIGRRGSYKDYVDLYFILSKQYASLSEIIDLAQKKYGGEFNARLFLEQLTYWDDVHDTEILFLKERVEKQGLEEFFETLIKTLKL